MPQNQPLADRLLARKQQKEQSQPAQVQGGQPQQQVKPLATPSTSTAQDEAKKKQAQQNVQALNAGQRPEGDMPKSGSEIAQEKIDQRMAEPPKTPTPTTQPPPQQVVPPPPVSPSSQVFVNPTTGETRTIGASVQNQELARQHLERQGFQVQEQQPSPTSTPPSTSPSASVSGAPSGQAISNTIDSEKDLINANKEDLINMIDALREASVNAESEYRDTLSDLANQQYQTEQSNLDRFQAIQQQILDHRNQAIEMGADVQRADVEVAYQKVLNEYDAQRQRTQKAYEDMLVEQQLNNKKRELEAESTIAALGGFGSLTKNKEMMELTLQNDRLINSIKFEREMADVEITNAVKDTTNDYQNDLYKIEVNKQIAISEAYDKFSAFVADIQGDRELSATEKYEKIQKAQAQYKSNIAAINQASFETKYTVSENAAERIMDLSREARQRQDVAGVPDPALSEMMGVLTNAYGQPILDAEGNTQPYSPEAAGDFQRVEPTLDDFGRVVSPGGVFDKSTGKFIPDATTSAGRPSTVGTQLAQSILNQASGIVITQRYGDQSQYEKATKGLDYVLPGGKDAGVQVFVGGTVVEARNSADFGNTVVIEDAQGNKHRYSHLSSLGVEKGETVQEGQSVGTQGNTGNVTPIGGGDGTHVDYRIQKSDGSWIDPEVFLVDLAPTTPFQTAGGIERFMAEILSNKDLTEKEKRQYALLRSQGYTKEQILGKKGDSILLDSRGAPISATTPVENLSSGAQALINGIYKSAENINRDERAQIVNEVTQAGYRKVPLASEKDALNSLDGINAVQKIREMIFDEAGNLDRSKLAAAKAAKAFFLGTNELQTALDKASDVVTRLRTGAALNINEQKFYSSMVPQLLNNEATIKYKLDSLEKYYQSFANRSGFVRSSDAVKSTLSQMGERAATGTPNFEDMTDQEIEQWIQDNS